MEKLEVICTCDDNCDDPCPMHKRENELQDALIEARNELSRLRAWKAGAIGAALISYPPNTRQHTEDVYCTHKHNYENGSEDYRDGADLVSGAVLDAKGRRT